MYQNEHEAFSASRCQDYVYVPNEASYYKQLDKHVDAAGDAAKLPLVVLGEPGVGKSALLANWVQRRKTHMSRDDFLFQHFVGSSPHSHQLADVLGRLETALKEHFHLREMEVPETEDRLRWGLVRYLEAASKKALGSQVMLIVIDGINALASEASSHGSLHWLPIELPANVRLILSTSLTPAAGSGESVKTSLSINSSYAPTSSANIDGGADEGNEDDDEKSTRHTATLQTSTQDDERTYMELCRRNCQFLRMAPLTPAVREQIVKEFLRHQEDRRELQQDSGPRTLVLKEQHQARIIAAEKTSCPLFLRVLLYALHVGATLPNHHCPPVEEQLNIYLGAGACPTRIVAQLLEAAKASIEMSEDGSQRTKGLLGHVLAAVHASRNGLSDEELYGLVDLAMGTKGVASSSMEAIFALLKGMTLVVNGLRSFSHKAFARVVFEKYVKTPEAHVRQHELMARYFQRFPSCPRKLDCLAYHLEAAGLWHKLKEALVDVENFRLWWSPLHKKEFVSLWASLTNVRSFNKPASSLAGIASATRTRQLPSTRHQAPRAYFDVVDEYVRSIEEYREKHHPKDDDLGDVVLGVADFLLEFAILGHEDSADVPAFLHPLVPNDDLKSLGVPYLVIDADGEACLVEPLLHETGEVEGQEIAATLAALDGATKTAEEEQAVSTYFYHRWMWIQFPLVAAANCGERYKLGSVSLAPASQHRGSASIEGKGGSTEEEAGLADQKQLALGGATVGAAKGEKRMEMPASLVKIATQPLPQLFIRKPTTARARPTGQQQQQQVQQQQHPQQVSQQQPRQDAKGLNEEVTGAMDRMASELHDDIRQYRNENDVLVQQKIMYERAIHELANELTDLERIHLGSVNVRKDHELAQEKERKTASICDELLTCNKNLAGVLLMCERHPPGRPALVQGLEENIEQETQLIAQIKDRVWEEAFEQKAYTLDYPKLRSAIQNSLVLQHELLTSRVRLRENLTTAAEANLLMLSRGLARPPSSASAMRSVDDKGLQHAILQNDPHQALAVQTPASRWSRRASIIFAKTGISEPDLFFHKLDNCRILEKQMLELKKAAELKLADMKDKQHTEDHDLYEDEAGRGPARSDASIASSSGGLTGAEEAEGTLELQVRAYKHAQEKAAVAMLAEQQASEGLKHIAELLGYQGTEGHATPVHEVIRHIEVVLAEIKNAAAAGAAEVAGASEVHAASSPYPPSDMLQRALASFQHFKSMDTPRRLSLEHSKALDQAAITFTLTPTTPIPEKA